MSEMNTYVENAIDQFRSGKRRSGDETIRQGIEDVISAIAKELHDSSSRLIGQLVHYTGIDVLFAMLNVRDDESGLRLYDTVHANDPEEGRFVLLQWPDWEHDRLWMWEQGENGWARGDQNRSPKQQAVQGLYPGHAYVLSFVPSENEEKNNDRLVFWREYGREGAGCSLSIPQDKLSTDQKGLLPLYRVRYGQEAVRCLAAKLRKRVFEPIEKGIRDVNGPEKEMFKAARAKVNEELQLFRYLYKDRAYEHEKEYRLVILDLGAVEKGEPTYVQSTDTRGETVLRHYTTHPSLYSKQILGQESRVILGPTVPHTENVEAAIETLLDRKGISGTTVTSSEIKYRRR